MTDPVGNRTNITQFVAIDQEGAAGSRNVGNIPPNWWLRDIIDQRGVATPGNAVAGNLNLRSARHGRFYGWDFPFPEVANQGNQDNIDEEGPANSPGGSQNFDNIPPNVWMRNSIDQRVAANALARNLKLGSARDGCLCPWHFASPGFANLDIIDEEGLARRPGVVAEMNIIDQRGAVTPGNVEVANLDIIEEEGSANRPGGSQNFDNIAPNLWMRNIIDQRGAATPDIAVARNLNPGSATDRFPCPWQFHTPEILSNSTPDIVRCSETALRRLEDIEGDQGEPSSQEN